MSSPKQTRNSFLEAAREYVGYRAKPNRDSTFGSQVGYPNSKWDGAFLDVCAREAGLAFTWPSLTNFEHSLGYWLRTRRARKTPKPGDLVYYTYGKIGVVTDTHGWRLTHNFKAVDAETASGLPRGPQESDGVYERVRYSTDVLAFVRPTYRIHSAYSDKVARDVGLIPQVRLSNIAYSKSNPDIQAIQVALGHTVKLQDATPGKYDQRTKSAVSAFQRHIGYNLHDATGNMDAATLERLATDTDHAIFIVAG